VHVNQGVFQIFMTEQDLKGTEIRAGLVKMRGETVTKRMGVNTFLNASALGGFLTGMPDGFRIDWPILAIVAGKQPGAGFPVVETPLDAECREQFGAEHDIAI
jgi:hypothetical protein